MKKEKEPSKYDKRNKLNNLTGKEWVKLTKSYWISEKCADDKFAFNHPAPFLIKDIEKLISFFTKQGMRVLDPFCGVGTTMVASHNMGRKSVGIDLNKRYCNLAKKRLQSLNIIKNQNIIHGDSLQEITKLRAKIDYCVTSPPYHNILQNKGQGLRNSKKGYRSGPRQGVEYYSKKSHDLGNQKEYSDFLNLFQEVMKRVNSKLSDRAYTSIIISDFTVDKKERNVQGDMVKLMDESGFDFVGTIALLQDNKPLYPFGYPFAYVINHHHQNIINFRKRNN